MSVPLLFLLLAPLAGAVVALAFGVAPSQRRVLVAICCAATLGGAVAALVRTVAADPVAWRGFSSDAWSAILALGAVASIVAGIARAGGSSRPASLEAALFMTSAAGVAPLLVREVHLLAVTLPVSTLAFASAALVASRSTPGISARRSVTALALSDVVVLVGLGTAVSGGTQLPPDLSVSGAALVLAGAAIRSALVPLSWGTDDARRESPVLASVWLGPIRAQGFLLLPFALTGGRGIAYAAAAAAGATALVAAARVLRGSGRGAASDIGVSLAVLGIALGGPVGLWGAVLTLAATFVLVPAWLDGEASRALLRPTAAALPAGALLPGAVLVVLSSFDAAAGRPELLAFAVPALAGTLALAAVAVAAWSTRPDTPRTRGDRAAAALWGWLAVAAAAGIAAIPQRVTHAIAFPVADTLGVGRLLPVGAEPGLSDDLAVIMLSVALLAFLAGPGRMGSGGPASRRIVPVEALVALPEVLRRVSRHERAWTMAGTVLVAASIGIAVRVYVEAAGRGFL